MGGRGVMTVLRRRSVNKCADRRTWRSLYVWCDELGSANRGSESSSTSFAASDTSGAWYGVTSAILIVGTFFGSTRLVGTSASESVIVEKPSFVM